MTHSPEIPWFFPSLKQLPETPGKIAFALFSPCVLIRIPAQGSF